MTAHAAFCTNTADDTQPRQHSSRIAGTHSIANTVTHSIANAIQPTEHSNSNRADGTQQQSRRNTATEQTEHSNRNTATETQQQAAANPMLQTQN